MNSIYKLFVLAVLFTSCSKTKNIPAIVISETAGFERQLEYINANVDLGRELSENESLMITNVEDGSVISTDKVNLIQNDKQFEYTIVFPVAIAANQTKKFSVSIQEKKPSSQTNQLKLSEDNLAVENEFYKATFSSEDDKRGGQVNGIQLKNFDNQLLKRGHIAMHWAPNFSKTSSDYYFNLEDLKAGSKNLVKNESYRVVKERSGVTDSVPEIKIEGRYEFYADLPYFLFESTMTVEQEVELNLLRNDEMTMDSLYTHLIYAQKDGSVAQLNMYSDELNVLEEDHMADDTKWLAFYNAEKGYGFGSIRLSYDNTNVDGKPSPVHNPYTKITRSSNNGRYWNRVLSDTIQTFPIGSKYYEKNAYLVFSVDPDNPEKEILHYYNCLQNPLKVEVLPG
ncbi:hypothetical protein JQC67_06325 [Aurantibacter crassamenti]|uniref:hypothetical protein n=1 Tax=Aurantibacter crassamenti TaxID=1837375 RepID=UPI0019395553|nr:hypothetical protein [Aurantibacter crassamenti]MBM1105744.1 hypothetical protein [Aurantibacter crassamenti]